MMAARTSSPASAFSKVLRSFETGGFTYRDVVAELKRLLKTGASPTELSEILRRREFVEPLPVEALEPGDCVEWVIGGFQAAYARSNHVIDAGGVPTYGAPGRACPPNR